jgi:hypothetical protein
MNSALRIKKNNKILYILKDLPTEDYWLFLSIFIVNYININQIELCYANLQRKVLLTYLHT